MNKEIEREKWGNQLTLCKQLWHQEHIRFKTASNTECGTQMGDC